MVGIHSRLALPVGSIGDGNFLGVRFAVGGGDAALRRIEDALRRPRPSPTAVMHANLHSLYTRMADSGLQEALDQPQALVLFEGIGLKVARLLVALDWWPDLNGTDLVPQFLGAARGRRLRVALVGGRPEVVNDAAATAAAWFAGIDVVATRHGYADLGVGGDAHRSIVRAEPELILLGLGTPLQEKTALLWSRAGTAPLIWCVGGLFDLWAGGRHRAPAYVRRVRLEWLWRLAGSPRALWRRTFVEGPWLARQVARQWGLRQ